ncbi:SIS domain-containing protein [Pelagibius sp. Alg239-R121]|uniref:SIS domain-containing protein n=1 Tax=Pelagibius sp. Alg239-R121 TaxID=2993448 RepID=UPI0024A62439|nr:SIS domain-containing protein [Pelagibius sp. Alg239-R121]
MAADTVLAQQTAMEREIAQAPEAVARLLDAERSNFVSIGKRLRKLDPSVVVTCARGSSDHAAGFFKYGLEILLGVPVASMGPSVASIYQAPLRMRGGVQLSISQSGQSPDIVTLQTAAKRAGALTIAIVNHVDSPLAEGADIVVPMHAGLEESVAATKSFIASAVAAAAIIAAWSEDRSLQMALEALPDRLSDALSLDWQKAIEPLATTDSLYVLGRGPSFPIAMETALKFKETMSLHAEAFSAAEVMHGPLSLVQDGFRIFAFNPSDASHPGMSAVLDRLRIAGAEVFFVAENGTANKASDGPNEGRLPMTASGHLLTDPIAMCLSSYQLIEGLARRRGYDPDNPTNLKKVTETV